MRGTGKLSSTFKFSKTKSSVHCKAPYIITCLHIPVGNAKKASGSMCQAMTPGAVFMRSNMLFIKQQRR